MKLFYYSILISQLIMFNSLCAVRNVRINKNNVIPYLEKNGSFPRVYLPFIRSNLPTIHNNPTLKKMILKVCNSTILKKFLLKPVLKFFVAPREVPVEAMLATISPEEIEASRTLFPRYFQNQQELAASLAELRANPSALLEILNQVSATKNLLPTIHQKVTRILDIPSSTRPRDMHNVTHQRDRRGNYVIGEKDYFRAITLSLAAQFLYFKLKHN